MSVVLANASNRGLTYADFPVQSFGSFTMLCWARTVDRTAGEQYIMRGSLDTTTNNYHAYMSFYEQTPGSAWRIRHSLRDTDTQSAVSVTNISNDTWYLTALRVRVASTSAYARASLVVSDSTLYTSAESSAQSGFSTNWLQRLQIGKHGLAASTSNGFDGYLAEAAIYDAELMDAQILDHFTYYANDAAVKNSLTGNLKAYWPLYDTPNSDTTYGGTFNLTEVNSPTYDTGVHPTLTTYSGASAVAGISRHYARMMTA